MVATGGKTLRLGSNPESRPGGIKEDTPQHGLTQRVLHYDECGSYRAPEQIAHQGRGSFVESINLSKVDDIHNRQSHVPNISCEYIRKLILDCKISQVYEFDREF